jgi:hypothetical protein
MSNIELKVPLVFNKKVIGYSGDRGDCRTIKFIDEELNHAIFGDKPILLLSLSDGDLHEDGSAIITMWVAEYEEDVDNNEMKSLKIQNDTKEA